MYTPKSEGEKKVLLTFLIVSGLILASLTVFYALNPRPIIGDALVNNPNGTPAEIPPSSISPFYVKPVTVLFASLVVFFFCLFSLLRKPMERSPRSLRTFLMLLSLLILTISCYETLFNFTLWGSQLVTQGDPDKIVNIYPISSYKINLVFATKSFVALIFVSFFSVITFKGSLESENT